MAEDIGLLGWILVNKGQKLQERGGKTYVAWGRDVVNGI
jgi:hypothetical protein